MHIVDTECKNDHWSYLFDNGIEVSIWPLYESWEFCDTTDEANSYCSGCYMSDHGEIYDYDGVFELPQEVKTALIEFGYTLNLD